MAWSRVRGFAYQAPSEATSHSNALGGSVATGDIICVCVRVAPSGSVGNTGATLSDDLGNTYTQQVADNKDDNLNRLEMWFCKVTSAGSPTITVKYQPTPDTSNADDLEMVASHFTGSDSGSAVEGTPVINEHDPNNSTDACTSTNTTPTTNGCLIYGCWYGYGPTGNVSVGTGYTIGSQTFTDGLTDEYKTQSTAAAVAATFTKANAGGHVHTGVFAVKPAAPTLFVTPPKTGMRQAVRRAAYY